jgi:alcohol dehydrogenase
VKAVVIHRYGGPEVMRLEDRSPPAAGADDVLIAVRAASLNPIDFKFREHKVWPMLRPALPITLGFDVAGVVKQVGTAVTGFSVGAPVFARIESPRMGALAELAAARASVVAALPSRLSFVEAASIPLAGLTALQGLRQVAGLQAGQRVLIHAGAGGVGSLAIQIAKILGAHVVTTTSTKNVEFCRGLGADDVIDYTTEDVAARAKGVDVVFDSLGEDSEIRSLGLVKPGGVVVGIGGLPDGPSARALLPGFARPIVWWRTRERRRAARVHGTQFKFWLMKPDGAMLSELAAWIEAGRLRPVVHATYPLDQFRAAFAELERGRARGKIVVEIAGDNP